jgi:hypothetical protein
VKGFIQCSQRDAVLLISGHVYPSLLHKQTEQLGSPQAELIARLKAKIHNLTRSHDCVCVITVHPHCVESRRLLCHV